MDKLENTIKAIYKSWKRGLLRVTAGHPSEETMSCLLESRLSTQESEQVQAHLVGCPDCAKVFALSLGLKLEEQEVAEELLSRVRNSILPENKDALLEVILRVKEKFFEVIHTTGDIVVGQELIPAPVLRSRQIKDFKDEVTVLKDFKNMRVELRIENQKGAAFNVRVTLKEKDTARLMKEVRVSLFKEGLELESYATDSGSVTFEHVLLGKYLVEITRIENKLASIILDIRK